jgi:hypothetical protein
MSMKSYIGTKIINARPLEKDGKPGYKVRYPDGYESWSPKESFEIAYREVTTEEENLLLKDGMEGAICIGCGCADDRACDGGCHWLVRDEEDDRGVCSRCIDHIERWQRGERNVIRR